MKLRGHLTLSVRVLSWDNFYIILISLYVIFILFYIVFIIFIQSLRAFRQARFVYLFLSLWLFGLYCFVIAGLFFCGLLLTAWLLDWFLIHFVNRALCHPRGSQNVTYVTLGGPKIDKKWSLDVFGAPKWVPKSIRMPLGTPLEQRSRPRWSKNSSKRV